MKKQLPQVKKSLKSFIVEEDAKVIDKTATKIAIMSSFASIGFLANVDDVNAKGHGSHTNHKNDLNSVDFKYNNEDVEFTEASHANHYNHQNGGSGNC
jgi:hypothetical protein